MRAGVCAVQQALTSEAALVLKQSLTLARRRGHAQVTPLHVAATLLSSRVSLFRRACLKSHPHSASHPLQCRALELCFNVSLNRLPTTPGPFLHNQPCLSNALIAALKRAQAHQRRGCVELQQQQPLLAIKVELEQLIVSILDDPSVSRVMKEAGFSSTCVKNNLEDSASTSLFYTSVGVMSSSTFETTHRELSFWHSPNVFHTQKMQSTPTHFMDSGGESKQDLKVVLEVLVGKKRRNTVIVGDNLSTTEGLVSQLMNKVERGEVPEELRSVHFIKLNLSALSLRFMKKVDVETKVADLRRKLGSFMSVGGAIIYAGDLKWVVEEAQFENYSPVNHIIAEIGRLIADFSKFSSKMWLLGIANYQTYIGCQMRTPPLEVEWSLQAVVVPSGGLGLSLHASSYLDSRVTLSQSAAKVLESKPSNTKEDQDMLICCDECTSNYEKEAGTFKSSPQRSPSPIASTDYKDIEKLPNNLPFWMQQQGTKHHHKVNLLELKRKWSRLCQSLHHIPKPQKGGHMNLYSYPPPHSWWPVTVQLSQIANSNSTEMVESASEPSTNSNPLRQFTTPNQPLNVNLDSQKKIEHGEANTTLALGNSLFSSSRSTSPIKGKVCPDNLLLVLKHNVPWQSERLLLISETVLDQRSSAGKGVWLLISGNDWIAKRRLALGIAETMFGSVDRLVHINLKQVAKNRGQPCTKVLMEAVKKDARCVIYLEEIEYADPDLIKLLSKGLKDGNLADPINIEMDLGEAVIIISTSRSVELGENEDKPNSVIQMKFTIEETTNNSGAPNKRKADWDSANNSKYPKSCDEQDSSMQKKSSFNALDLNVAVEGDPGGSSSDETSHEALTSEFLESIRNRFILDSNPSGVDQIQEKFRFMINSTVGKVWGSQMRCGFRVEGKILEELASASAYFLDGFFEKWLEDVFQTSLATVTNGGKDGVLVSLCFGGKEESVLDVGFLGSNLPKAIQIVM